MPSSLKNLIKALFFGNPLKDCNNLKLPSSILPSEYNFLDSDKILVTNCLCVWTSDAIFGFSSLNS